MKRNGLKYGRITLRPMQREIIPKIVERNYYCLSWSMRTGKTFPLLIAASLQGGNILIVCPPNCIPVWESAITKLEITNSYKIISSGKVGMPKYIQECLKYAPRTLIIDEIHQYRSFTNRFKGLMKIRRTAQFCYAATGTIIDKDFDEIFYIVQLLDEGELLGTNRSVFREKLCNPYKVGNRINWKMKPELEEAFKRLVFEFISVHRSDKVQPPQVLKHFYHLTKEQKELITDLEKPVNRRKYQGRVNGENLLVEGAGRKQKILQITSGFWIGENETYRGIPTNKFGLLRDIFKNIIGKTKAIVWVRFIEEYHLVYTTLKDIRNINKYNKANLEALNNGTLDTLICHPKSAGVGVDISVAQHALFLTESWSNVDSLQAKARLDSYEGKETKTIHYLLAHTRETLSTRQLMEKKEKKINDIYENHSVHQQKNGDSV